MAFGKRWDRASKTLEPISVKHLVASYERGERDFMFVDLNGADLSGIDLRRATFYGASLRYTNFQDTLLTDTQIKSADCTGACFNGAILGSNDLIGSQFTEAQFRKVDFTGTHLASADCTRADFSYALFNNTVLADANFAGSKLTGASLSSVYFKNADVGPFCSTKKLKHSGPSSIDSRTVIKSHSHPGLKRFMLDCGTPEIFATYMIDCARASSEPILKLMMQSTFISYGAPDEAFARKIYDELRAHHVVVFFFPETATLGERINNEVFQKLQDHDRVLLVCSRKSLTRAGVVNEIQETLDREARDGGATYLLPVMLDDYVLKGWREVQPVLAERLGRRIIGDFRGTDRDRMAFGRAMARVIDALKRTRPQSK